MSRFNTFVAQLRLILLLAAALTVPAATQAEEVIWTGEKTFDFYDCGMHDITRITVRGPLTLVHGDDRNAFVLPKKIRLVCDNLHFESGAIMRSMSALDIRIGEVASGSIVINNTRGVKGVEGITDQQFLNARQMSRGANGAHGSDGQDARCRMRGLEFDNRKSRPGARGKDGAQGQTGSLYSAPKGAPGRAGAHGADIVLVVREFEAGTTLLINARGGDGGLGGVGGAGADGGVGGRGGDGGQGGDASSCRTAAHGGNGGNGGRGGDGGNGGSGGDGGDGGDGGNVFVIVQEGLAANVLPLVVNDGGLGGQPGQGGAPGAGGAGGAPGNAGCGGSGSSGVLGPIDRKGGGKCAGAGVPGDYGADGKTGPQGAWGADGRNGESEPPKFRAAKPEDIQQLLDNPG
jgi:hypothetical protein